MSHYDEDALEKFRLSGRILRETREEIKNFVREDMPIIDICEKAEKTIMDKGGKPAFPCNVSINEIAAHYTSPPNDNRRIPRKSIVKVDIGVHVDGYLTDTAVTICFNPEYKSLVDTAEQALKTAINSIHPEMSTSKLGAIIEKNNKISRFQTDFKLNWASRHFRMDAVYGCFQGLFCCIPEAFVFWVKAYGYGCVS